MPKVNFDFTSPTVKHVSELKNKALLSFNDGNYKEYKQSLIELAKIGVDNFELVKNTPSLKIQRPVNIFSKDFFNLMKVFLLNKFRIKTPEEKRYAQIAKEYQAKEEYKQKVRERIYSDLRYEIDKKINPEIDRIVNKKTDKIMGYISSGLLEQLGDNYINTKSSEQLINGAVKDIPKSLRDSEKNDLYQNIYNTKFLKETLK